jgi:hypothetical protein
MIRTGAQRLIEVWILRRVEISRFAPVRTSASYGVPVQDNLGTAETELSHRNETCNSACHSGLPTCRRLLGQQAPFFPKPLRYAKK